MYDQFYGFNAKPFQLTPDPRFYFESGTHRKALSYLGYGLAQGEGFIVITGEVGSGKSTLVGHLMQTIDKARLSAATIVTSQLDGHDLVQMAAESFGIHTTGQDKAATLKSIEEHLHSEARAGRRCLLIVDEAQNLSVDALEELRMLSNFQLGSDALLQIFLLGQPEFRDLVHNAEELEQLRQRIIATHHLEAMEADEVEPYITHRLSHVGWTGRPRITADAVKALYSDTDGVPRKLNTLMNRVLLMASVEQVEVIDGDLVAAVVADMAGKSFEYSAPKSAKIAEVEHEIEEAIDAAEDIADDEEPEALSPSFMTFADASAAEDNAEVESEAEVEMPNEIPLDILAQMAVQDSISGEAAEEVDLELEAETTELAEKSDPVEAVEVVELTGNASDRIVALEAKVTEQDDALRRVLAMMIDWMDNEQEILGRELKKARAA